MARGMGRADRDRQLSSSSRSILAPGLNGRLVDVDVRYVRDRSFCEITEATKVAFAPRLDNPQCFVGYTCFEPSGERDRLD
jgi:hypothetical protein